MKLLLVVCALSLVIIPRECIGRQTTPFKECEDGTYEYLSACSYRTKEPTCEQPNPLPILSFKLCDYRACYCDPPTVRDEASGKCVQLEDCPKTSNRANKPNKPNKPSKPKQQNNA